MILSIGQFFYRVIALIDFFLFTIILYLLSFLPKPRISSFYPSLFQYWCTLFVRALGVDLKLHQKNQHPLPSQYILIGNHPSVLEDIGMPSLFPVKFLAKVEVKDWWIVGRMGEAAGTLYVDRESKSSRQQAIYTLLDILKTGKSVGLYPEGGCKGRRLYLPFLKGAFDVSFRSGIPIVPVFLHYEAQDTFEWHHQHLLLKLWQIMWAQNRRAHYYVFDALDPLQFENKEALCEHVQNLYLKWQEKYLE